MRGKRLQGLGAPGPEAGAKMRAPTMRRRTSALAIPFYKSQNKRWWPPSSWGPSLSPQIEVYSSPPAPASFFALQMDSGGAALSS